MSKQGRPLVGLHGTSLWSARHILASGWSPDAAAALMTPRMHTPPDHVYAVWLDEYDEARALWIAQQWAIEAAERAVITPQGRRYRGAVLAIEVDPAAIVTPRAERIAPASAVRVQGVVSVGRCRGCECDLCRAVGLPIHGNTWRWRDVGALSRRRSQ